MASAPSKLLQSTAPVHLWANWSTAISMWDAVPVDLFFLYDDVHRAAATARRRVPFGDGTISILAADHLTVCKVAFDRPKDWVDIDSMIEMGTRPDPGEVLKWVARIAGDEDRRYVRIAAVLAAPASSG